MKYTVDELEQLFLSKGTVKEAPYTKNQYSGTVEDIDDSKSTYYYLYKDDSMQYYMHICNPIFKLSDDGLSVNTVYTSIWQNMIVLRYNPDTETFQYMVNFYTDDDLSDSDDIYEINVWDDFNINYNNCIFFISNEAGNTEEYFLSLEKEVKAAEAEYYKELLTTKPGLVRNTLLGYREKCKTKKKYYESEENRALKVLKEMNWI